MTPSRMEMENRTVVSEFILLGIPNTKVHETILFISFLAFYLSTLLGNLLIFSAILADSCLHTPMYFFLCNLSVLDLGFASISTLKLLISLWTKSRTISLGGCMSQLFIFQFLGSTEGLLYTVMAFDSSFHATILTSLTFTLPYCGPNTVDYFFCDIFSVAKLACADTYIIETVTFTNTGLVPMTCFFLILISYVRIVYSILKMNSSEGRSKAASTCASHLTVVTLFFGPCILVYMQPRQSKVLGTAVHLYGYVATPVLNPVIYTLRNKGLCGN
ncbi:olfactory receptor 10D3-like, partial [Emydura macquarii macquarii]|uniref:olfactory receptor 10D3-like n=1 Tax=Emydura macquarii macquarii TaxID=1129001 RepID=UPI00352B0BC4